MKRTGLVLASIAAVVAIAATASIRGLIPGTRGCTLRSVDKRSYVAANEAVFRTIRIPRPLRAAYKTTWTHAVPARHQCLPRENGPPFGAYVTTRVYIGSNIGFDDTVIRGRWTRREGGDPRTSLFRRDDASLVVTSTGDAVLITVDHLGYAGRGD